MPRKPNIENSRYNDPFPTKLRQLMDERGTRQEDLIDVLGVKNRQSVTGYRDGSTLPTIDKIVGLANYFDVSTDYLLGLTDVASPDIGLKACCAYTHLSERAMKNLAKESLFTVNGNGAREALDDFLSSEQFFKFFSALVNLKDCVKFASGALQTSKDNNVYLAEVVMNAYRDLKLSVYELSEEATRSADYLYHFYDVKTDCEKYLDDPTGFKL